MAYIGLALLYLLLVLLFMALRSLPVDAYIKQTFIPHVWCSPGIYDRLHSPRITTEPGSQNNYDQQSPAASLPAPLNASSVLPKVCVMTPSNAEKLGSSVNLCCYIRKKPLEYIDLPSQCSTGSCVVCGPDYSAS